MIQSLITISIIGLIAGFIFSIPIAGPVSILVTSNALKGRLRYCNLLASGASLADFIYVLVAVYGITKLFYAFREVVPYILGAGAFFVLFAGFKIFRTKFDLAHIDEESRLADKQVKKGKGAFSTGFLVNFLNPTLFFSWLLSSFIALSFATSLGFDTGGLNSAVDQNLEQIEEIEGISTEKPQVPSYLQFDTLKMLKKENRSPKPVNPPSNFHLLTSLFYSIFLSVGSLLWFIILTMLLVKFRRKVNINILNRVVKSLGIILCLFGVYLGYTAVKLLF